MVTCLDRFRPGLLATVESTVGATDFLVKPPDSLEITALERAIAPGYS
jgi:hypothetical protein